MAAVRAHIMHTKTRSNSPSGGRPFAATTSAPSAKGNAKIVCENRISRMKRPSGPPGSSAVSCGRSCEFTTKLTIQTQHLLEAHARTGENRAAMRRKQSLHLVTEQL